MKIRTALPALAFVLLFAAAPSLASARRSDTVRPDTPASCIERNHADWNACNVGNNGRGDRPYKPATPYTPNECIRRNHGDWNACNVGNSGRGDRPYKPVPYTPNECIRRNHGDWTACNVGNSGRGAWPYLPPSR